MRSPRTARPPRRPSWCCCHLRGFARWSTFQPFREFVFGIFADRLADLMALAEAVAFQRLDQRLAAALLGHGSTLRSTHQALADELGTVREIVTRLLKRFEQSGWVALGRGTHRRARRRRAARAGRGPAAGGLTGDGPAIDGGQAPV